MFFVAFLSFLEAVILGQACSLLSLTLFNFSGSECIFRGDGGVRFQADE